MVDWAQSTNLLTNSYQLRRHTYLTCTILEAIIRGEEESFLRLRRACLFHSFYNRTGDVPHVQISFRSFLAPLKEVNSILSWTVSCGVCGFYLACEDAGERFSDWLSACALKKKKKLCKDQLARTTSTLQANISPQWLSEPQFCITHWAINNI